MDCKEISPLLALPTDGKPISLFLKVDKAWKDVYDGFKRVIEHQRKIKSIENTEDFLNFLNDAESLTKASAHKEAVALADIFIHPELMKFDDLGEHERKIDSQKLIESLPDDQRVLISGENQSGRTTLCKMIFMFLRRQGFIPVYVSGKDNNYKGLMVNRISEAFKKQYKNVSADEIDKRKIIPILDDFHFAKNREKHVDSLSSYGCCILTVDDISTLNFRDEYTLKSFSRFSIKEFSPSLRNQLIEKWVTLTDRDGHSGNKIYGRIDGVSELVDTSLGKVIGGGIMPAYPFFILSIITIHENFKPLEEITSQGYCYQALIYIYLRKSGVANDEIDTYINFLTEFSFFFFESGKSELSGNDFDSFMKSYLEKYNFPVELDTLLRNLQETRIISLDNFGNYSFRYPYLYYFFVSKYLAEHIDTNKEIIAKVIANLHKDENAYIAIFMSHHSKNSFVLDKVTENAKGLFEKYAPTKLSKEELGFFDKQADMIIQAALPPKNSTPAKERAERLKTQDEIEETGIRNNREDEDSHDIEIGFRRSMKTADVMGNIIKNRAGSLEKKTLESIFEEGVEVYLRILTSFFSIIENEREKEVVIDFISYRLDKIIKDRERISREQLEKISEKIFWNLNFLITYSLIEKIIHSLGSNKLSRIIDKVCDEKGTPAYSLIKHGISMWYNKNLQIDDIAERIKENDFSEITRRIVRFMIVDHASMHVLNFEEMQRIESKFAISSRSLLISQRRVTDKSKEDSEERSKKRLMKKLK
uniref:STAND NTPase 4 small alpha/beta domain-containing protein n=1 Tax=Candidatus Kentrum sp. LFY TaxID=2126342 RepID=A0A450UQ35_9GAMM|nr:MAG: hypothetical protein BECKLFY1418B_GA0070995_106016 [Candidatus Kentron sp. LFY]